MTSIIDELRHRIINASERNEQLTELHISQKEYQRLKYELSHHSGTRHQTVANKQTFEGIPLVIHKGDLFPCPFCKKPPYRDTGTVDFAICKTSGCAIKGVSIPTSRWQKRN